MLMRSEPELEHRLHKFASPACKPNNAADNLRAGASMLTSQNASQGTNNYDTPGLLLSNNPQLPVVCMQATEGVS